MHRTEHLAFLSALEQRILWLSAWMIHHANHVRENADGLKVGGASGIIGLACHDHDCTLRRDPSAAGPRRGQTLCSAGLHAFPSPSIAWPRWTANGPKRLASELVFRLQVWGKPT